MKKMRMGIWTALVLLSIAATVSANTPKYIFFFIGDGMSTAQIQAAEAYLTTKHGGSVTSAKDLIQKTNRLNMTTLPVLGMQTTFDAHSLITDSASAATALSCGIKTMSGVLGMDETTTNCYKNIAQLADEQGKRIGILSSVSLNHATPAAFFACAPNRGYLNNIATQLVTAEYDFYGGGGIVSSIGPSHSGETTNDVWNLLAQKGYSVLNDRATILELKQSPQTKVVCINPVLQEKMAMPYAIDQDPRNLSLAEMTSVAIEILFNGSNDAQDHRSTDRNEGFFLVVEGGKIDWACHANDAMAAIGETLDFDNAVGVAVDFYHKHPQETLIVVTGDHETGGMSIGHQTTGYSVHYERLLQQKMSFTAFKHTTWDPFKLGIKDPLCDQENTLEHYPRLLELMENSLGIAYDTLNGYQKKRLEEAFDLSLCGANSNSSEENTALYGRHEPIIVTITHILNEQAGIGWTSYAHTGVPVPVFAIGMGAQRFAGLYDNTDIAKKLALSMGIDQPLPVRKGP
ncbi:alkaline phosphatase [uncultured Vibrio sp.]|uniref:alkaline phosphatase n=1 Tax=uncultured Vibrio sp. TaxID=114054 RepID=UPI002AA89BCC|nr:alkaline phosphatase [uncultured Vibrio sp.]